MTTASAPTPDIVAVTTEMTFCSMLRRTAFTSMFVVYYYDYYYYYYHDYYYYYYYDYYYYYCYYYCYGPPSLSTMLNLCFLKTCGQVLTSLIPPPSPWRSGRPPPTVNPRKLEHGFRRISARIPYTLP